MIVYVSIGNSDDKLTQESWADFIEAVDDNLPIKRHGVRFSAATSKYQNACWCVEVDVESALFIKGDLAAIAEEFGQDSIAWAEVKTTEFLGAGHA